MKTNLTVQAYIIKDNKVLLVHHKKHRLWLPPGGHIEENETTDDALKREVKEEINIDIEFLNKSDIPVVGSTIKNLATPFYVNLHDVGDHLHCGIYYLCRPKTNNIKLKTDEVDDFKWFSKDDLKQAPEDVRAIAEKALELAKNI